MSADQQRGALNVEESDGSPSCFPFKLVVSNATLTDNADGTCTVTTGGGGGTSGWTDNGTDVNLTTSTDNVGVGGSSLGKLSVDGDTDEIQLLIQANATQTTSLVTFENSAGTDVFTVSNTGVVVTGGTAGAGISTINAGLTVNNGSGGTGNDDFKAVGDTDANLFVVDASADMVGVGTSSPGVKFDVNGAIRGNNNITSTQATDLGWSLVSVTNQACNTTCTNACVFGFTLVAGVITTAVACTDATADQCVCAGAN